tara:strand:- start:28273 stop:28524 length:252 start_codon:yes stop_codon:yes gene_type:complete
MGILEIILIVTTILEFNPLLQGIKMFKHKNVENISIWTYIMIFVIGLLWFIYGYSIWSIPLIIGNGIKILTSLVVMGIYIKYK